MRAEDGSDDHNRRHQGKPRCRANDILRLVLQRENENSNTGQCFQKGYNGKAHLVRIAFSQPLREECNHRSFSLLHFGAIIAYASSPPQPCLLPRGTGQKAGEKASVQRNQAVGVNNRLRRAVCLQAVAVAVPVAAARAAACIRQAR